MTRALRSSPACLAALGLLVSFTIVIDERSVSAAPPDSQPGASSAPRTGGQGPPAVAARASRRPAVPDLVLPTRTNVRIRVTCVDFDTKRRVLDCTEPRCELDYVATRVTRSPQGFMTLDRNRKVQRTIALGRGKGGVRISRQGAWMQLVLQERGTPVLHFKGLLGGGSASEATFTEVFFGVLFTPGAQVRVAEAVSLVGPASAPAVTREEYRAGVKCEVNVDPQAD